MEGAPITELNGGIDRFFAEIWATTRLRTGLDLGIVAFSSGARVLRPLSPLTSPAAPKLEARGDTPMGEALRLSLALLKDRAAAPALGGCGRPMPWLVLMSDGNPTDAWESQGRLVRNYALLRELAFVAVGVGEEANLEMLASLTPPDCPPVRLHGLRFGSFFTWLRESLALTHGTRIRERFALPAPGDWATERSAACAS
jgi:uncharacterized protein YegL